MSTIHCKIDEFIGLTFIGQVKQIRVVPDVCCEFIAGILKIQTVVLHIGCMNGKIHGNLLVTKPFNFIQNFISI